MYADDDKRHWAIYFADVAEADGPVIETVIFMNIAEENFHSQFDLP
jgi:hypothetical protein